MLLYDVLAAGYHLSAFSDGCIFDFSQTRNLRLYHLSSNGVEYLSNMLVLWGLTSLSMTTIFKGQEVHQVRLWVPYVG